MNGERISDFTERFGQLIDESEETQSELAKALGVSRQTISAWRMGIRTPISLTIVAIAEYFGVSSSWLSGMNSPKHNTNTNGDTMAYRERIRRDPSTRLLLDATEDATEEEIRQYVDVIKALRKKPYEDE